jgi:hypothetical protein
MFVDGELVAFVDGNLVAFVDGDSFCLTCQSSFLVEEALKQKASAAKRRRSGNHPGIFVSVFEKIQAYLQVVD